MEIFSDLKKHELKKIYEEILANREEGLRPRILDKYIKQVQKVYPLSISDAWAYVEKEFWKEVSKRFFAFDE